MLIATPATPSARALPPLGSLRSIATALVWLAVAAGAVVFTEPAPVDVLTMGLVVLLPLAGLTRFPAPLFTYLGLWTFAAVGALVATAMAPGLSKPAIHSGVSIYLYAASFVMAGFVACKPGEHTALILRAYLWASFVAALAGVVGYFGALPGASELFTKFGRAAGTFKDPNVYGPFLVTPFLYSLHLAITRPLRSIAFPLVAAAFLAFATLLSFSRGAWFALAVAVAVYGYISFVTARSDGHRLRLVVLGLAGVVLVAIVVVAALQIESVAKLLAERASVTQSYDVGPEGRFGGQEKARALILENPLGIGATIFASVHHHEDVHNVYLSMFLNAGWLGGLFYALTVLVTVGAGLRHAFMRMSAQPLFLIAYAAFVGHVAEGFVIDTDHWRHFYLLAAIVWGLMTGDRRVPASRGTSAGNFPLRLKNRSSALPLR